MRTYSIFVIRENSEGYTNFVEVKYDTFLKNPFFVSLFFSFLEVGDFRHSAYAQAVIF